MYACNSEFLPAFKHSKNYYNFTYIYVKKLSQ